jgi:deoxyribodipyrimidine photo-lyase
VKRVIHWFRRDLRLSDNTALSEADRQAEQVFPVFVLEDALQTGPDVGAARLTFLLRSVEALRKNLESLGYVLIIRRGRSVDVIPALARELSAQAVFANRRYEPYAVGRDSRIFNALNEMGVGFEVFKDAVAWEGEELLTQAGRPFTVFTPYAKAWKSRVIPAARRRLSAARKPMPKISSEPLPADSGEFGPALTQPIPEPGERAGRLALKRFLAGPVYHYAVRRDRPDLEGTSGLSPYLRCGTIGVREIYFRLGDARESGGTRAVRPCDVWLNELIWREFYLQILTNFPRVAQGAFHSHYDRLEWSDNEDHFTAWSRGQTGYPLVDAAMRCLNATGTMHNRLRMVVAMFLTKDLLMDWRKGERYFMQQLVDGDMAANNGGWQWSAGTGTDAAPYFRIFNPVAQGEKFDPDGEFVRRWVPELAHLSADNIHAPWRAPLEGYDRGYAPRLVVHEEQRKKCLTMFRKVKA